MSLRAPGDDASSAHPRPAGRLGGTQEERRAVRAGHVAAGTLACPSCDAPIATPTRAMTPLEPLGCGFCGLAGPLRDFLSLAPPTRPTRVVVRVRDRR